MKLNKGKNKGKVHPSPSSSSTPPSSSSTTPFPISSNDAVSSLNHLLPTAILTLISILSLQDKEVLAYMITHSLSSSSTPSPASSSLLKKTHNNNNKQGGPSGGGSKKKGVVGAHKVPAFDCGCFDCFASYWYKWDSSPHRELIHQAIEAFEEHLVNSEQHANKKSTPKSSKKKDRLKKFIPPTPTADVAAAASGVVEEMVEKKDVEDLTEVGPVGENGECSAVDVVEEEVSAVEMVSPGRDDVADEESGVQQEERQVKQQQQQHKGLARKVLPDVIGLINSRLWNLWGPNV